jgi:ribonucleoside-diphosphate reductase subunit M2
MSHGKIQLLQDESDYSDNDDVLTYFDENDSDVDSDEPKMRFDDNTEASVQSDDTSDDNDYLASYHSYKNDFTEQIIKEEPILSTKSERYTVFPVEYPTIWKNYKTQIKANWIVEEVDLSKDIVDWEKKLSHGDRNFLMHVLAFFAASDGIVATNLEERFTKDIKIREAKCAYGRQLDMENIHGEMYSLMLETFIKNITLKEKLINSIKTMPCIRQKAKWCEKWIESDRTFAHRVVAFAVVEGVFFSGSFAAIFWLKTRAGNIMPGLIKSNMFISRDEGLHMELACLLYKLLNNKLKEKIIYEIFEEAVEIEEEFINTALPCKLLGMNSLLMSQYIRYVADRLLVQLGYNKKYNVENPFEYMKKIDVDNKANFFEERNDAYADANVGNKREFSLVVDF